MKKRAIASVTLLVVMLIVSWAGLRSGNDLSVVATIILDCALLAGLIVLHRRKDPYPEYSDDIQDKPDDHL